MPLGDAGQGTTSFFLSDKPNVEFRVAANGRRAVLIAPDAVTEENNLADAKVKARPPADAGRMFVMHGIVTDKNEAEITEFIYTYNNSLVSDSGEIKVISVRPQGTSGLKRILFRAKGPTVDKLIADDSIKVDFQWAQAKKFTEITQCMRCCGYDHPMNS